MLRVPPQPIYQGPVVGEEFRGRRRRMVIYLDCITVLCSTWFYTFASVVMWGAGFNTFTSAVF